MITLTVMQGPDTGRRFTLADEPALLGRDSKAVPLADDTCSRRHAKIGPDPDQPGAWRLEDMGSSNGTYVNGQRALGATPIVPGDQIKVGRSVLLFGSQPGVKPAKGRSMSFAGPEAGMDSAILDALPSGHDSVMLAAPDPAKAAMKNLATLYELSARLGSSFSVPRVCEVVLDQVFENLDADRAIVLLVDDKTGEPRPVAARARDEADPAADTDDSQNPDGQARPSPASRTIVNHVLATGEGVLSSNAMGDDRFKSGKSVHHLRIRSALCAPIRANRIDMRPADAPATLEDLEPDRQTLGVIYVDSSVDKYSYGTEQLELLNAIGWQAGLAVQNAKLYQQGLRAERLAAVGETTAALSHGIKNILQALRGGADVVDMGFRRDDLRQAKKGWGIVERNLERIYGLTLNLLAWSKPRKPKYELVQPARLIRECLELLAPLAAERGVTTAADVEPDLPAVPLDGGGMHQVLMNLLTNALEAMPDNDDPDDTDGKNKKRRDRRVTAGCRFDAGASRLKLWVADTGTGVAPAVREHLFELFHSTKGNRGTGLGLPVVQKIVREHDGQIDVATKPGRGTTFTITLPVLHRPGDPAGTIGRT